jgi:uncharacterized membrane protein YozB (DUF420 family)
MNTGNDRGRKIRLRSCFFESLISRAQNANRINMDQSNPDGSFVDKSKGEFISRVMGGFLGTGAPFKADVNLVIQILMGLTLLVGMFLARQGNYRAHAFCQTGVALLNLILIGLIMLPSFRLGVLPGLPHRLGKPYYSIATLHTAMGSIAELLGLYIVLRANTNLLPKALCFQNYKLWMRSTLALWWAVILFGLATYYVWL